MSTNNFRQRDIDEAKRLIAKIKNTENGVKTLVNTYVFPAYSSTSKKVKPPNEFVNLILDIKTYEKNGEEDRKSRLNKLKESYLHAVFIDSYQGGLTIKNFTELETISNNDSCVRKLLKQIEGQFNMAEKLAKAKYDIALNQTSREKKMALLGDALKLSIIGGTVSLLILRDLVRLIVGENVGKTETHLQMDQDNRLKQKNKLAVA
jgi:hypothetical protein